WCSRATRSLSGTTRYSVPRNRSHTIILCRPPLSYSIQGISGGKRRVGAVDWATQSLQARLLPHLRHRHLENPPFPSLFPAKRVYGLIYLFHHHHESAPVDVVAFARILCQDRAVILTRTAVNPGVLLMMNEELSVLSQPPQLAGRRFGCVHFLSEDTL